MTILVDNRVGSAHLAPLLGPQAQLTRLEFGDVAFSGNGARGQIQIGVECKTISDALACMSNGRFSGHQAIGLTQQYDRYYFLVEGLTRSCDGLLQIGQPYPRSDADGKRIRPDLWEPKQFGGYWNDAASGRQRYTYRQFANWLQSIDTLAGIRVLRSTCESETVQMILALESWWAKPYDEHATFHVFAEDAAASALLVKPPLRRRVASELPLIAWERSGAVAKKFPTTYDMVNATVEQWLEVDKIGTGIASKVYDAIRSE